jgi:hypothetical protein
MKKNISLSITIIVLLAVIGGYAYQYKGTVKIQTAESPEEIVEKFYSYVSDGGPTSLAEAYRLLSTKNYKVPEERFKAIVLNYPSDLKVNVIDGNIVENVAVVPIEYETASAFGGVFTVKTEVNLDIDEKTKSWKIDFTGETYDRGEET